MDPKALASLDPKLRETYEKVMGTSTNSTTPSPTGTPPVNPFPTPPIPAPVKPSSLPNIPKPASPLVVPNNSTPPAPPANTPMAAVQSSLPTPDIATLQATPTGMPLPTAQSPSPQPAKPIQPLPSPASINKGIAASNQPSPVIRSLYIIASLIFFVVYAIFWLKIFRYPLPF